MALTLPFTNPLTARSARPAIIAGGVNILAGVASQNILTFTYADNTGDQADDLSLSLADPQRTWMKRYLPKKGMEIQAHIVLSNWNGPGDNRTLKCGTFYVDNVGLRGPPNAVTMRGTSIPTLTGMKTEKVNKSWEDSELKAIAGEMASKHGLTLVYDAKDNPMVKRTDQVEKADIQYLRERAKDNALNLKIHDKKLVIYSEKEYEAKTAAFSLIYGKSNILTWEFNSKCDDVYESSENAFLNQETGKLTKTPFTPPNPPEGTGAKLKINERVDYDKDGKADYGDSAQRRLKAVEDGFIDYAGDAPAQNAGIGEKGKERSLQKAQSKLREKNKKERECSMLVTGNIAYLSGINFQLINWGIFDGKWFAYTSIHEISESGYTTHLKLRTSLEGY